MAKPAPTITTPLPQNQTNSCSITHPWFLQKAEYGPAPCTFQPLVNGEDAFGAVYQAIHDAKHTVDIICWGFQPSMYFKRGTSGNGTLRIGELLTQVSEGPNNVKVRLLCWHDDFYLAELSENNMPGYDSKVTTLKQDLPDSVYAKHPMLSRDYQTPEELAFDMHWYWLANLSNVTHTSMKERAKNWLVDKTAELLFPPLAVVNAVATANSVSETIMKFFDRKKAFKNFEMATRDFNWNERAEIAARTWRYGASIGWDPATQMGTTKGQAVEPTHHQKMVLVDYEYPDLATGFVMGHNMLDQYWDTKDHSYQRKSPKAGRSGPFPWQDISSRVTGPILYALNKNFCEAWDDATGQELGKSRQHVDKDKLKLHIDTNECAPVMAQVVRTQSQKHKFDIAEMYGQAVRNTAQHIFIQNQYFRWPDLAKEITDVAADQLRWGRTGPLYLFVITNSSDEAVGNGTVNTYRMLDSLGYGNTMPGVEQLQRQDSLVAQQNQLETDSSKAWNDEQAMQARMKQETNPTMAYGEYQYIMDKESDRNILGGKIDDLKKAEQRNKNVDTSGKHVVITNLPHLKVHICTLVAPDSPKGQKWTDVYVHAKLMTIDDAFMTLGSANINRRSMGTDSELNIFHENGQIAKKLRQDLWTLHAGRANDDPQKASSDWDDVIGRNKANRDNALPPVASLVEFMRTSKDRSYDD
jgi:phosphatidylserine/phosphatidylglycerophosphate/cardiolipin synthase-like enzyme